MLRNQRKGWIAPAVLAALLLAPAPASAVGPAPRDPGSWIVRLAAWLGLPPSITSVWEMDSAHIDPDGQPRTNDSGYIDPLGQPGSAKTDSSAHIDPNG